MSMWIDPYRFRIPDDGIPFSNVVFLYHYEALNGVGTYLDSSSYARVHSAGYTVSQNSTFPKYGVASCNVGTGGTGGGKPNFADAVSLTLGTSSFVFETFVRFNAGSMGVLAYVAGQSDAAGANANTSIAIRKDSTDKMRAYCCNGAATIGDITGTTVLSVDTWYYVAYTRSGSNFALYVGTSGTPTTEGTASSAAAVNDSAQQWTLGGLGSFPTGLMTGQLDESRFSIGAWKNVAVTGVPIGPFNDS